MKSLKKCIVFIPILCILFSVCTPFISYATNDLNTRTIRVGCPQPLVSDTSGYILLQPRYDQLPNIEQPPFVFSWSVFPQNGEASVPVNITVTDSSIRLELAEAIDCFFCVTVFSASATTPYYTFSSDEPVSFELDFSELVYLDCTVPYMAFGGNVGEITDDRSTVASVELSLIWSDNDTQYKLLNDVFTELLLIYSSLETSLEYDLLFTNLLEAIYNSVSSSDLTLQDVSAELIEIYSLLSDYLKKIYTNTDSTVAVLDRIWEDFYYWTWVVDEDHARIIELLEHAIQGEKPSNQDSFQDSYDDYADIEQGLINNEEASNAIGDFDVSIEGGAYSVIWNMITDFLNSNAKVFGLFIACLTLAFIALLLHR